MIKALIKGTIVIGISDRNIELLKQGKPILFNLKALGLPERDVLIFTGKTEQDMYKEIKDAFDPLKTAFSDDNGPNN